MRTPGLKARAGRQRSGSGPGALLLALAYLVTLPLSAVGQTALAGGGEKPVVEPEVVVHKSVTNLNGDPTGATGRRGDTLQYTVRVENRGPGNILEVTGVDLLPQLGRFVSGSLEITEGPVTGFQTDALDDGDLGGFDPTDGPSGAVQVRLGVIEEWGLIAPGESAEFRFRAVIDPEAPIGSILTNTGIARYQTKTKEARTQRSNRVHTEVIGSEPTVRVVKEVTNLDGDPAGATGQRGDTLLYTVRVTNEGPGSILEVTGVDVVPEQGRFVPGSLEITEGPVTGFLTDPLDDGDLGGIDTTRGSSGEIQVRLGVIEDWGLLSTGQSTTFRFLAVIREGPPAECELVNRGIIRYETEAHEARVAFSNRVRTVCVEEPQFADIAVDLSHLPPDPQGPGDVVTYLIKTRNLRGFTASEIDVAVTLPPGARFISAGRGGTVSGRRVSWPVHWELGVRDVLIDTLKVVFDSAGTYVAEAEAFAASPPDPDLSNNRDRDTVTVVETRFPDMTVAIVEDRRPFVRGQQHMYTVTVTNVGQAPATEVSVRDDVHDSLVVVRVDTAGGWTLGPSSAGLQAGAAASTSTSLFLDLNRALDTLESASFDVFVDVLPGAPDFVDNVAQVFEGADPNLANDVARLVTPVVGVDLAIRKDAVGEFSLDSGGTFQILVTNGGGTATVGDILVVDSLPEGLTYTRGEGAGWTFEDLDGGRVVRAMRMEPLDQGASTDFRIHVDVAKTETCRFENYAFVQTVGDSEPTGDNRDGTGPLSYFCGELELSKEASEEEVERTDLVHYTLTVTNAGTDALTAVQVTDRLPVGFELEEGSVWGATVSTRAAGGVRGALVLDVGRIAAGDSALVQYSARAGPGAPLGPANNVAEAADTLRPEAGRPMAMAEVRVVEGPFSDEGLILGKVAARCVVCQVPGLPGDPDLGMPGVRVYLQDGTSAVTDAEGKYSFYGLRPRSWVVRLDPSTVPIAQPFMRLTNRHSQDGTTLFVDLTRGELARGDFVAEMDTATVAQWLDNRDRRMAIGIREGEAAPRADSPGFRPLAPTDFVEAFRPHNPGEALPLFEDQASLEIEAQTPETPEVYAEPIDTTADQTRRHFGLGVLEGRLDLRSLASGDLSVKRNAFEDRLTRLTFDTDDGKTTGSARLAAFLKGDLTKGGGTTYSLRVESEDEEVKRFFRDIRPEDFYGLYGDDARKQYEAQSRGRFFGRVENGPSYLQWGDFNTAWANDQAQQLGRYVRTLSGLSQHFETDQLRLDAFASRERFSQVVDEIPALGISGPYELTRSDGLINSERVEVITRDRNQPSRILRVEVLERFLDYSLEPFTGRLLLKRPVPSLDEHLNPVSIRIAYELEQNVNPFWVVGVDARAKTAPHLELGGGFTRDNNPLGRYDLGTLNATVSLPGNTFLIGEWARSDSAGVVDGGAGRAELQHQSDWLRARAFYQRVDSTFANPSAGFLRDRRETVGRIELGFSARARSIDEASPLYGTSLLIEALRTKSLFNDGARSGVQAEVDRRLGETWALALGIRRAEETAAPASGRTEGIGPYDLTTLRGRLTYLFEKDSTPRPGSAFLEYEQDVSDSDKRRLFVGGDWRVHPGARLYGRHELISSLEGPYALNGFDEQNNTVLGLSADALGGSTVYSEYRIRDAFSGREAQAAIGLRNSWRVKPGVVLSTSFERVDPLSTDQGRILAVTSALEYTRNPLWKGTLRGEFRATEQDDQLLGSFGFARKLNRDVSVLGQSVVSHILDGTTYSRTRVGIAYRNTLSNLFNALARYEHRYESRPEGGPGSFRAAHIVSTHGNWVPSTELTIRGQYAAKWAEEQWAEHTFHEPAGLVSLRGTYDVTDVWDVGATVRAFGLGTALPVGDVQSREWGLGFEVGVNLSDGLRLAGGYNAFGFTDEELTGGVPTDRGFYLDLSWTFDDGLLGRFWDDGGRGRTGRPAPGPGAEAAAREESRPRRDPAGGLAPLRLRYSDQVLSDDLARMSAAQNRIDSLIAVIPDAADPVIRYQGAKARAWLALARVEYLDMDTTAIADTAFVRATDLIRQLSESSRDTLRILPVLPPRVDPDGLPWLEILELAADPCIRTSPEPLAQAEVRLGWAANEYRTLDSLTSSPHDSIAAERIRETREGILRCIRYPVPDRVHFAQGDHHLSRMTLRALDWVGWVLRTVPYDSMRVVLRGQVDQTGDPVRNRELVDRRAAAVMTYLQGKAPPNDRLSYDTVSDAQVVFAQPGVKPLAVPR